MFQTAACLLRIMAHDSSVGRPPGFREGADIPISAQDPLRHPDPDEAVLQMIILLMRARKLVRRKVRVVRG